MSGHSGYVKNDPVGRNRGNLRNGKRTNTVPTDPSGPVEIEMGEKRVLPSKSAIIQARTRLPEGPLADLFATVARPIGRPGAGSRWLAGRRLVAMDDACLELADTLENDEHVGRPPVRKGGRSAFPSARRAPMFRFRVFGPRAIARVSVAALLDGFNRLGSGMQASRFARLNRLPVRHARALIERAGRLVIHQSPRNLPAD